LKKKKRIWPCIIAASAALAIWAVCDSKYNLQVTEYELYFESLPAEFDGFRIVQLSDLHGMEFGENSIRLIEAVKKQAPDLIALTGDFATHPADVAVTRSLMEGLYGTAAVYSVNGNHEWAGKTRLDVNSILDEFGARRLENEYDVFERGGARIVIAGAEDPNGNADMIKPDALAAKLREEYPDDFVLWLGHRNYWVKKYPQLPVNLILSGHAHGGIVRLPLVGGLLSIERKIGAEYESGVYNTDTYTMLVSRGLGNSIRIPRIFNRPEIVVIKLRCK